MSAGRHRHRAEPVGLAQHNGDDRHLQLRGDDEHPADVPHLAARLDLGPDHEAGRVDQRDDRQAVRVAELHEARRLVAGIGVDRAAEMRRVAREDADGRPSIRASAVTTPAPKPARSSIVEPASTIASTMRADRVDAQRFAGSSFAQRAVASGAGPVGRRPWKIDR
jgi:hypothetical protein